MKLSILQVEIRFEHDVVLARQRTMQIAAKLGFNRQDQVQLATAVSEIARNAFQYAVGGMAQFFVLQEKFFIRVADTGGGLPHLEEILQGRYVSNSGLGLGIPGAKRLVDHFEIESQPGGGTTVLLGRNIPPGQDVSARRIGEIARELVSRQPEDPFQEIQKRNQELVEALQEIQTSRSELQRLNQELEDTNRGVVALYAELDEKAGFLRRASEIKSRFLSNMTHEFRTPVNSILSLCRILLDRVDGELTPEQEKQITFIESAAADLSQLVNDLLDLAKVEAGRLTVQTEEFEAEELFAALHGTLKPLLAGNHSVRLVFEKPAGVPTFHTDEAKVAQILRNLISNALKFTRRGEVRVGARLLCEGHVEFTVSDTGVGIAPENQQRVFEEFVQLRDAAGNNLSGTGLGLPIARRLAQLLGGNLSLESQLGVGSRFSVVLPIFHGPAGGEAVSHGRGDVLRYPVLVLDGNTETLFACERFLKGTPFQVIPARSIKEARNCIDEALPLAIILDAPDQTEKHWAYLREVKTNPRSERVPVFVVSDCENRARAFALGADDFHPRGIERDWLLEHLRSAAGNIERPRVLVFDPDETSRQVVRDLLRGTRLEVLEASTLAEAQVVRASVFAMLWNASASPRDSVPTGEDGALIYYDGRELKPGARTDSTDGSSALETLLGQLREAVRTISATAMQK